MVLAGSYGPRGKGVCVKVNGLPCHCIWAEAQFRVIKYSTCRPRRARPAACSNVIYFGYSDISRATASTNFTEGSDPHEQIFLSHLPEHLGLSQDSHLLLLLPKQHIISVLG